MVRRVFRLLAGLAVMIFLGIVFTIRLAPDFLPAEKIEGAHQALPQIFGQKQVQVVPPTEPQRAMPAVNRMAHISRQQPAENPQPAARAEDTVEKTLPLAQRKTIRVGD